MTGAMPTPTAAASTEARALAEAFGSFMRCLKQHRATDGTDHGVTMVLMALSLDGPLRPSELAKRAGLDLSTVSRHIRGQEMAGHLTRTDDPDDRRAFRVELTEEGRVHIGALKQRNLERFARLVADWPTEDISTLTRLVLRLRESIDAAGNASDDR